MGGREDRRCHDGRLGGIISVSLVKFKEREGCVDEDSLFISKSGDFMK